MKTVVHKRIALLLTMIFAFSLFVPAGAASTSSVPTDVFFAPRASDYLSDYDGSVRALGDGIVEVVFEVFGTRKLSSIGAKKIIVYRLASGSWMPVKTYSNVTNPELSTTNKMGFEGYIDHQGIVGEIYKAEITIFGESDSRTFTTNAVRAT